MNIQNTTYGHFIIENKNRIVIFIFLFVLSSMKMFGQSVSASNEMETKEEVITLFIQQETSLASLDSQIDFVGWFMGSKLSHDESQSTNSNTAPTKKQILSSGIAPNKVLYRTFMKRISCKDNAIV